MNRDNRNVAKLVNRETYIALLSFFLFLDKKIKIELTRGKNIKVDRIGKFILMSNVKLNKLIKSIIL